MISKDTVFILGAGASAPYGYPKSAGHLKDDICLNFKTDMSNLFEKSKGDYLELGDLMEAADDFVEHFQNSRIQSIDKWLYLNSRYRDIGKLAIVNAIVKCEDRSQERFEGKDKSLDWFSLLFNEMMLDVAIPEHFYYPGLYFITFNYDRVFEHLLYESFRSTFSQVRLEEINRMLSNVTIIHVYGCIDGLPWEERGYNYGGSYKLRFLDEARKRIKTVSESISIDGRLDLLWRSARKVFFLGFGYDPQNLNILGIPQCFKNIPQPPLILGTGQGLFQNEIYEREERLLGSSSGHVIQNCDCTELLRKHLSSAG